MNKNQLLLLKTITPLHAGSGVNSSYVDLPIQREQTTGYPKIEASSFKGALKHAFKRYSKDDIDSIFGTDGDSSEEARLNKYKSGEVSFSECKILTFPVRSIKGVYSLITSRNILERYFEYLSLIDDRMNEDFNNFLDYISCISEDKCICLSDSINIISQGSGDIVKLGNHTFDVGILDIYYPDSKRILKSVGIIDLDRLIILNDSIASQFLSIETEIVTRIRIEDDENCRKVENGLFTEELLPEGSVLYSLLSEFRDINTEDSNYISPLESFCNQLKEMPYIQVGGDATLGRGKVKVTILKDESR